MIPIMGCSFRCRVGRPMRRPVFSIRFEDFDDNVILPGNVSIRRPARRSRACQLFLE